MLSGESRSWFAALRFGRREWRFLGYILLIATLMAVPVFVVDPGLASIIAELQGDAGVTVVFRVSFVIGYLEFLLVWIYGARLMLVFPAVAADETGGRLARAWQRGRGNTLRVYFGSALCVFPFAASERIALWILDLNVTAMSTAPSPLRLSFSGLPSWSRSTPTAIANWHRPRRLPISRRRKQRRQSRSRGDRGGVLGGQASLIALMRLMMSETFASTASNSLWRAISRCCSADNSSNNCRSSARFVRFIGFPVIARLCGATRCASTRSPRRGRCG